MRIENVTTDNCVEIVSKMLSDKVDTFAYGIVDKTMIYTGENNIDMDYCKVNNIVVYPLNNGGTIVANMGDLDFSVHRLNGWEDYKVISNIILNYLKTKINTVELNGNDFIADGQYKVGSFCSKNVGDNFIYTAFHFSNNVNLELINRICSKEMVKIPKGLVEYNVNVGDILSLVLGIIKSDELYK